jgi:hypothetical protein
MAGFILCSFFAIFIASHFARAANADSLEDAARALARRVAASLHGGPVTCTTQNRSSLNATEFASVSAAFVDELQRQGVKLITIDSGTPVSFTVTQNPTGYLAVVQLQRKENPETLFESLGSVKGIAEPASPFSLELHRELLFVQDTPILDMEFDSNSTTAFVLGPQDLSTYGRQPDHWALSSSERLPRHQAPARIERGFLGFGTDMASAEFSDELCQIYSPSGDARKGWHCEKNATAIRVRGVSWGGSESKKRGAWLSAAQFEVDKKTRLVMTGPDGLARLYEDGSEPVASFSGWGGEIASLRSGCGRGWQLLVTGSTDWTRPDAIQAVEVKDRRAVPMSAAMEFPGPIVALHTPGTRGVDPSQPTAQAFAVDHNLQTGRYEAYLLSINCAH